ncbi:TetR family transcriptional regulator [Arthrobacter sp. JSM 101049]|uniref:TetR family transcriptional regulator n=1 Tax=Arthrobacter sp. JSM 101049 TaxID=929097 RepID=UPI00356A95C6
MRSIDGDATTQARIRDAAITLFGQRGFAASTVRDIATAAGISPGLVIHHFGSKAGLRTACDTHVLESARAAAGSSNDPEQLRDVLTEYLSKPDEYSRELAYIRQSVVDDSAAGDEFFDAYVRLTGQILAEGLRSGTMRQVQDPLATATWMVTNSLGLLVLGRHVARSLGNDEFGIETINRIAGPAVELYTHPLYTDESFLQATRDVVSAAEPEG